MTNAEWKINEAINTLLYYNVHPDYYCTHYEIKKLKKSSIKIDDLRKAIEELPMNHVDFFE